MTWTSPASYLWADLWVQILHTILPFSNSTRFALLDFVWVLEFFGERGLGALFCFVYKSLLQIAQVAPKYNMKPSLALNPRSSCSAPPPMMRWQALIGFYSSSSYFFIWFYLYWVKGCDPWVWESMWKLETTLCSYLPTHGSWGLTSSQASTASTSPEPHCPIFWSSLYYSGAVVELHTDVS